MFVDVLPVIGIGFGIKALLTYRSQKSLHEGALVIVPFGPRRIPAFVVSLRKSKPPFLKIRDIEKTVTSSPFLIKSQWKMLLWLAEATATPPGQVARLFVPPWVMGETEHLKNPSQSFKPRKGQRKTVFDFGNNRKMRKAIQRSLLAKRQVLVLAPTNALAENLAEYLRHFQPTLYFGGNRTKERDLWNDIRIGKSALIIGSRSALFLPFSNLDLLAITDETNPLYFHEFTRPKFHIPTAAKFLAQKVHATLLLTGTVPSLDTWRRYEKAISLTLPQRNIQILDLKKRKRLQVFTKDALMLIDKTINNGGKIFIFAARRGEASVVVCRDCGAALVCPRCEAPMPVFRKNYKSGEIVLRCRHCGQELRMALACPVCRSLRLTPRGIAAQAIASDLAHHFPHAALFELSSDATSNQKAQKKILDEFAKTPKSILIATHMALAMNVPQTDLIIVATAEQLVAMQDFRAEERFFETIIRLKGMLEKTGTLAIQAWRTQNTLLDTAARGDWNHFAKQELILRKSLAWPPFRRIAKLTLENKNAEVAERQSQKLILQLKKSLSLIPYPISPEVIGPSPGLIPRPRGKHIRILIVKWKPGGEFDTLVERKIIKITPPEWEITINPSSII